MCIRLLLSGLEPAPSCSCFFSLAATALQREPSSLPALSTAAYRSNLEVIENSLLTSDPAAPACWGHLRSVFCSCFCFFPMKLITLARLRAPLTQNQAHVDDETMSCFCQISEYMLRIEQNSTHTEWNTHASRCRIEWRDAMRVIAVKGNSVRVREWVSDASSCCQHEVLTSVWDPVWTHRWCDTPVTFNLQEQSVWIWPPAANTSELSFSRNSFGCGIVHFSLKLLWALCFTLHSRLSEFSY